MGGRGGRRARPCRGRLRGDDGRLRRPDVGDGLRCPRRRRDRVADARLDLAEPRSRLHRAALVGLLPGAAGGAAVLRRGHRLGRRSGHAVGACHRVGGGADGGGRAARRGRGRALADVAGRACRIAGGRPGGLRAGGVGRRRSAGGGAGAGARRGAPGSAGMSVVRGGAVVTEAGVFAADVALDGGRIVAVGRDLPGETVYDATGLHVFAGFVDPHVHGCDEGLSEWEDFATLTAAALAGGVTTLLDMPLNEPPTTTAARLRARGEAIEARSRIAIGLFGGAVPGNVAELEPMARAGAVALKAFMVETPDWERCDDGTLLDAMREAARLGLPFAVHAEDQELVAHGEARERAAGRHDVAAHAAAHDERAETAAIQRALLLARWAGCRLHVVHVGAREGLALLRAESAREGAREGLALLRAESPRGRGAAPAAHAHAAAAHAHAGHAPPTHGAA